MDGGPGDDHLNGGGGSNIVWGSDGSDRLLGGRQRDILIGGTGADRIVANGGDDSLLAGWAEFDPDGSFLTEEFDEPLRELLSEWNRTDITAAERKENIQDGIGPTGRYKFDGETVFNDHARDRLTGAAGIDWFLAERREITDLRDELFTDLSPSSTTPLSVEEITVNEPAGAQRSKIETLTVRFNQDTNLQALIDSGEISRAVFLAQVGATDPISLAPSRFRWDAVNFALTIDLTIDGFGGSRATMLADARYDPRPDTRLITAADSPDSTLVDDDGLDDLFRDFEFHRLQGDWDGDADVDLADRDLFFQHFGSVDDDASYDFAFDFTGDGTIDRFDYYAWKRRHGRVV